ncbi:MAG: glycosyltransferase family protein [Clostridiales Family XIII bacterium]|nr:glycosyltransferase family protein [Clostridia bacterium]MDE8733872.1 glycosyltransferase family protein [Eubacteriales bacterium DFI.9.88]MDY3011054.1 glycosyltransferase family protein [Clostridiales Family XIII bacterium]
MKIGCIIQARMTSSRLPGKVLKTLDFDLHTNVLEEVIRRIKKVKKIDYIIVATTINGSDNPIIELAKDRGVLYYRGSESNVLERYYKAAEMYNLDHIIRITSDCPFVDPEVIGQLIDMYLNNQYDYVSNGLKRTFPHGLDCEMFSWHALENAYENGKDIFFKEHVTTYIYGNPDKFTLGSLELSESEDYSNIRITIDTKEDYIVACIIKHFIGLETSFRKIIELYNKYPFIKMINEGIMQKKKYTTRKEELVDAVEILKLQECTYAAELIAKNLQELS